MHVKRVFRLVTIKNLVTFLTVSWNFIVLLDAAASGTPLLMIAARGAFKITGVSAAKYFM